MPKDEHKGETPGEKPLEERIADAKAALKAATNSRDLFLAFSSVISLASKIGDPLKILQITVDAGGAAIDRMDKLHIDTASGNGSNITNTFNNATVALASEQLRRSTPTPSGEAGQLTPHPRAVRRAGRPGMSTERNA